MCYQAVIYRDAVIRNTIIANSLEVLKSKCEPWNNDVKITSIKVMKVEDVGYFKLSKEFEEILKVRREELNK